MGAPECLLPPPPFPADKQPPQVDLPSIPTPDGTLAGIQASVMALKRAVERLSGQQQPQPGQGGGRKPSPSKKPNTQQGRWQEQSRATSTERIYNPQDKSQYVDVNRINQVVFTDKVTGETFIWKL